MPRGAGRTPLAALPVRRAGSGHRSVRRIATRPGAGDSRRERHVAAARHTHDGRWGAALIHDDGQRPRRRPQAARPADRRTRIAVGDPGGASPRLPPRCPRTARRTGRRARATAPGAAGQDLRQHRTHTPLPRPNQPAQGRTPAGAQRNSGRAPSPDQGGAPGVLSRSSPHARRAGQAATGPKVSPAAPSYPGGLRPGLELPDARTSGGDVADPEAQVLGVIDSFVEQHRHVAVEQGIGHRAPSSLPGDQAEMAQHPQLVGDR